MIENLGAALQALKQEVAQNVDTPLLLTQDTLARQFHGLSLTQLVILTDASVLATIGRLRLADGTFMERIMVDGKSPQQRDLFVRRLLLDERSLTEAGSAREIMEMENGTLRRTMMRDADGIVYAVSDGQAVIDEQLTAELLRHRQPVVKQDTAPAARSRRLPVVVNDPLAFYGTAGEIMQGLMALNTQNKIAFQVIQHLAQATAGQAAGTAFTGPSPELLADSFRRVLSAAQQIETLVDSLNLRMTVLLQLVERAEIAESETATTTARSSKDEPAPRP